MFSVIFEVHPKKEQFDLYLALAKDLRPILQSIDGFIGAFKGNARLALFPS